MPKQYPSCPDKDVCEELNKPPHLPTADKHEVYAEYGEKTGNSAGWYPKIDDGETVA
jgi:hypothetical protein